MKKGENVQQYGVSLDVTVLGRNGQLSAVPTPLQTRYPAGYQASTLQVTANGQTLGSTLAALTDEMTTTRQLLRGNDTQPVMVGTYLHREVPEVRHPLHPLLAVGGELDRKSTRLNSSHM